MIALKITESGQKRKRFISMVYLAAGKYWDFSLMGGGIRLFCKKLV